jgi:putative hydrolase of the HAD superfamily
MAELEQEPGLPPGGLQALLYEGDSWYDLSTARLDEDGYWRILGQAIHREPEELRRLLHAVWQPDRVDEDVIDVLRAVRPHARVAMLSNATLGLEEHLLRLGVAELFDPIINSARVGLRKPDPRIFRHALEILRVPPQAILFVDDKERNTAVAVDLGIPSVLFDNAGGLAAALVRHGVLPPRVVA